MVVVILDMVLDMNLTVSVRTLSTKFARSVNDARLRTFAATFSAKATYDRAGKEVNININVKKH